MIRWKQLNPHEWSAYTPSGCVGWIHLIDGMFFWHSDIMDGETVAYTRFGPGDDLADAMRQVENAVHDFSAGVN